MAAQNVICLVVDRLHVGYLGAYGNTWISTPAIDRLAAESFLFERAMIDTPELAVLYRSLWLGLHAMCPAVREAGRESLAAQFGQRGWRTALVTDEKGVAEHPLAGGFAERVVLPTAQVRRNVAPATGGLEETDAAAFFAAASEWIGQAKGPAFLWLHTGTLGRAWDAPIEYRQRYADPDDPQPGDWSDPPCRQLAENFDPDERVAIAHAYAGQVTLVDELIGTLLAAIDEAELGRDAVFVLLSSRGYPLGEHLRVGACDDALYAELAHVPLMIRLPDGVGAADRSQALVQPADLAATLLDACGLAVADRSQHAGYGRTLLPVIGGEPGFDRACAAAAGQSRIETPAWALRMSPASGEATPGSESAAEGARKSELFVKPDDWFEVNEVSDRCREVVAQLESALADFERNCETGQTGPLAKLPDELVIGME